ncbi:molybdopterin-dependent oxidoreductase [Maricurvus nonylphenolicus]|uniref:molybdopterin-containing oxidoreductase family protein n=1 Tax=Maricurvus nonylphenolicus TaxID=1008307 RepID=UPI0036F44C1A
MAGAVLLDADDYVKDVTDPKKTKPGVKAVKSICASCDIACNVAIEVKDGKVERVRHSDNPMFRDNICMKAVAAPSGFNHETRITKPLRRVGERGSGQWEEVSWDEAMADIGKRLNAVIDQYGPEAWAVTTSQWNTGTDHGLGRRIMNHVGSPNWISGVALCAGNTAAVNRMTYGWFPAADIGNSKCIVLFGHNPKKHSWVPIHNQIQRAIKNGAKLIVLDPRKSENAEQADIWLPLKAGSDAAMCLGWLKVIFDEGLYDRAFVEKWTIGFEELRERVNEYPLERVAELTGCEPEAIAEAARLYATGGPSVIPWTPITDMQRNSTSGIRLQSILRAVCGHLDVPGGDVLQGFHPDIVPESDIEMHYKLSIEQQDKQLGSDKHPAFTYRGQRPFLEPGKRVWGREYNNQLTGCFMANPTETFKAMAGEGDYPVKAFFLLGNNPLMSYANMPRILKGMMNQDLIVAHEQFMTPSAQLADYILPGDSWFERPWLTDSFGWMSFYRVSQQAVEPRGEAKSTFEFWRQIATAIGRPEIVPWATIEEFYDYRLEKTGMGFKEFSEKHEIFFTKPHFKKFEQTGFATPSGKVELKSSVLEDLGFDPLPYFREDLEPSEEYPLTMFTGVREDEYFQTGHRHIPEMRKRCPEPYLFVSPAMADKYGLVEDEWAVVENSLAAIEMKVGIRENMPDDLVRVPHGWWKPETETGVDFLSSAYKHSDAMLCLDDEDHLDWEQGIPHLKGLSCRVRMLSAKDT